MANDRVDILFSENQGDCISVFAGIRLAVGMIKE